MSSKMATFGAGCFWGVEARLRAVPGVTEAVSGYMGGSIDRPSYQDVCTGQTGHAEVVQVQYDPERLSYAELLAQFFSLHDPTTLDRQGPDVGTQYRSVIFTHDDEQERQARTAVESLEQSGRLERPIVTQVVAAGPFWRAEDYHQRYLEKNHGGYCHLADNQITISDLGLK